MNSAKFSSTTGGGAMNGIRERHATFPQGILKSRTADPAGVGNDKGRRLSFNLTKAQELTADRPYETLNGHLSKLRRAAKAANDPTQQQLSPEKPGSKLRKLLSSKSEDRTVELGEALAKAMPQSFGKGPEGQYLPTPFEQRWARKLALDGELTP